MSANSSKEIRSIVTNEGNIEISIANVDMPIPGDDEVLIEVHAAPINPSDLGLLLSFAADLSTINVSGSGDETITSMKIHPALMGAMKPRIDQSMPAKFGSHAWKFSPPWVLGIGTSKKSVKPVVFVVVVRPLQRNSPSEKGTCFARGQGSGNRIAEQGGLSF